MKKNFKIRNISGGLTRESYTVLAETLSEVVGDLGAKLLETVPGWALAQDGFRTWEISWRP